MSTRWLVIVGVEGGGHGGKLSGSDGADDRAGARALRSGARGLLGRWRISGTVVTSSSTKPAHTKVYEPVPATKDRTVAPHQPNSKDSPGVAAWRRGARMVPDEAKAIYKNRAATAECINAQSRNRGLQQFRLRGLAKVKRVGSCSLPWPTT